MEAKCDCSSTVTCPYLVSGVAIPDDQFPILRSTNQQPAEKNIQAYEPLVTFKAAVLDSFLASLGKNVIITFHHMRT